MRDSKSLFLLIFALVLISIAFALISLWGYHFYFQNKDINGSNPKDSLISQKKFTRDSLQNALDSTIQQLGPIQDTSFSLSAADSSDTLLQAKLLEYRKLKAEITEILNNKTSRKDSSDTNKKIEELQQNINELRLENDKVNEKNEELNKIVRQLKDQNPPKSESSSTPKKKNHRSDKATNLPLLVSNLRFHAVAINGDLVQPTDQASEAARLDGSFQVNIKSRKNNSPNIYVIVIQPNGRVLLNSAWESGSFSTSSGMKVYSVLLHFDSQHKSSRLQFSINANRFQKGEYVMEIYHNGIMIGRLTKKLS